MLAGVVDRAKDSSNRNGLAVYTGAAAVMLDYLM